MKFAVESWSPDYGSPVEAGAANPEAEAGAAVNLDVECPAAEWAPIRSETGPAQRLALVDGVRRIDARVWVTDDAGRTVPGLCASYAAGVIRCETRAEVVAMEVERGLFVPVPARSIETMYATYLAQPMNDWARGGGGAAANTKPPRPPGRGSEGRASGRSPGGDSAGGAGGEGASSGSSAGSGSGTSAAGGSGGSAGGSGSESARASVGDGSSDRGTPGDPLQQALQRALRELEIRVAKQAGEADLVVIDGSLRGRQHLEAAVGYVKSHWVTYLDESTTSVIARLAPGERTPMFKIEGDWIRYSWYLRLPGGEGHPWAGVVRCEVSDQLSTEDAQRFANLTAATLPRFASEAHKDTRAPQNLYPIAGLERELRRRLGDANLLLRGLRIAAGAQGR
ncbi:MAG: DNA double-strand break repair nuclease NurA [Candidatus Eisenbacteria bacterium]